MIWWLNNDTEDKAQKRRYNVITSHRYLYIVLLDTHSYLEIRKALNLHVTDALSNLHPKSKPPEHTLALTACFYTPPLKCGEVLCYTLRCLSVCPSVRPCSPFPIDNLSIYSRNFFKFCIYIVIGDECMGLLMGKIRPFLTELLPFFVLEKWFLACYSFTVHDI